MNKGSSFVLGAVLAAMCAQTPAQAQAAQSPQLAAGSTIPAMLEKGVDARKNKIGDEVFAKTTENVKADGKIVIPKGSRIVGHVTITEAKAKTKEQAESIIGIAFDHAVLKDGHEIPLPLEIQAVAPDETASIAPSGIAPATASGTTGGQPPLQGEGAARGPVTDPTAGSPVRIASPANGADGTTGTLTPSGGLTPQCHGVLGIDGLALSPNPSDAKQGSLIFSRTRNVHLDGRTQLMLRVTGS